MDRDRSSVNRKEEKGPTLFEAVGLKSGCFGGSEEVVFRFLCDKTQPATGKISLILEA